jgi:GT2 family glycosyltransferase
VERSPVAVVIVTYQSEQVIAGCLDSLPEGTRVVVVDNASTDGTVAAATRPGVQIVRNPVNAGFAAGVNLGIKAAEGYDVLVLNADIRLHPGALETLRAADKPIVVPRLVDESGALSHSLRRVAAPDGSGSARPSRTTRPTRARTPRTGPRAARG